MKPNFTLLLVIAGLSVALVLQSWSSESWRGIAKRSQRQTEESLTLFDELHKSFERVCMVYTNQQNQINELKAAKGSLSANQLRGVFIYGSSVALVHLKKYPDATGPEIVASVTNLNEHLTAIADGKIRFEFDFEP